MKIDKKSIKRNLKLRYNAFYRQWKVFYRSKYGKVGFYIMLGFVVITLISPLLVHGNPFLAVPTEDYTSPVQVMHKTLDYKVDPQDFNITATVGQHSDSYYMFSSGNLNGRNYVFAISSNNGSSQKLFPINGSAVSLVAFTPYDSSTDQYQTYIMAATIHHLYTTEVYCNVTISSTTIHTGKIVNRTVSSNITKAYVNTGTFALTRPPELSTQQVITTTFEGLTSFVFALEQNSTGNYLTSYITANLHTYWSKPLKFTPNGIYFMGNEFGAATMGIPGTKVKGLSRIIVTGTHNLTIYNENGNLLINKSVDYSINNMYIPEQYQSKFLSNGFNSTFIVSGNHIYKLNIVSGGSRLIYTSNSTIMGFATSEGSSGIPSSFLVSTQHYLTTLTYNTTKEKLVLVNIINAPFEVTKITRFSTSGAYILSQPLSGKIIYLVNQFNTTINAFSWHANTKQRMTDPLILFNPYNLKGFGSDNVVFLSGPNLSMYSVIGNVSVIGPTFHTESGLILPLGINSGYQNVWAIFISAFPPDLEVGFAAGIITILISVLFAMWIGYFKGLSSALAETFALAIFNIPGLPFFIVLATILGPSILNMILIFSLLGWPFVTFSLVGIVRSVKSRTFVDSAIVSNLSTTQVMRHHILPNMGSLLAYLTAVNIGGAVAAVTTFEILGLVPITIPTWGGMLSGFLTNYFILSTEPWVVIPSLVATTLFILAFIFIARGIDEVVNPTLGDR
jgi:peptide/nickel transport system permease protein